MLSLTTKHKKMNIIQIIRESWEVIALVITGLGGIFGSYLKWKSNKNKSTTLLYEELEKLKKRIIEQVPRDIKNAQTIAQQNFLLEQLKEHCPDCYQKVKKLNNVEN